MVLSADMFHSSCYVCVMKCSDCGVVGEGCDVLFVYLFEVADEIFEVGAVLECAKSVVSVSVIVFTAACRRTTDAFWRRKCTSSNVFRGVSWWFYK